MFSEFAFLAQWWSGSNCTIHIDDLEEVKKFGHEHSIAIMNHKYDIDWLMTWILSDRLGLLGVSHAFHNIKNAIQKRESFALSFLLQNLGSIKDNLWE